MERSYSGLEASISDYRSNSNSTYEPFAHVSSPYRSKSEEIVADVLKHNGISFGYEDALHVSQEYAGGRDRTWHPDFNLHDLGIIVEYVGMSDNEEYMQGIEKKKEVYEKMGVTVVWLYPEDLWEATDDKKYGRVRDDAEENILNKIEGVVCDLQNAKSYSAV